MHLGKYQVLEHVGSDALTEVYRARLDGIAGFRRDYAIQLLRSELAPHAEVLQLEEEARYAAMLSHSHIVQLLDLGKDDEGRLFIVTEWLGGWTLADVLERLRTTGKDMPAVHVAWIGLQVLYALEYAHGRTIVRDGEPTRVVHQGLCPEVVRIGRNGEVKVGGFGLARAALLGSQALPDMVPSVVARCAPEMLSGQEPTAQADLFSLGAVLYEAIARVHPFDQGNEEATRRALAEGKHVPIGERRPDMPEGLLEVVSAALSLEPVDRPGSATAFKDALADVVHGSGEVFTQASLAGWVSGLFAPPPGQHPVAPLDDGEVDLAGGDEMEWADEEDQRTVIGLTRNLAALAARAGRAPPMPPGWEDEGETVVQPEPVTKAGPPRDASFEPSPSQLRHPITTTTVGRDAVPERTGGWVAGAVTSAMMLVIGILLGVVAAMTWGRSAGMTTLPPMLDVRAAPDVVMQVSVDGDLVDGPQRLTAGDHRVRVDVVGAEPWEVDLRLQEGEYRLMMIEADRIALDAEKTP